MRLHLFLGTQPSSTATAQTHQNHMHLHPFLSLFRSLKPLLARRRKAWRRPGSAVAWMPGALLGFCLCLASQAQVTMTDIGPAAPTPGPDDITQFSTAGDVKFPDGL